ncbi:MAG: hypothetical protein IT581_20125 [Verrucomicrobiales bacterium]|nr:hypothetical protein [Verrucomicrobiales bacterium]
MKTIPAKRLIASLEAMGILKRLDSPNEGYGFKALWELLPGAFMSGKIRIAHVQGICSEHGHTNGHRYWLLMRQISPFTSSNTYLKVRSLHSAIALTLAEARTFGPATLTMSCLQAYLDHPNELPLPKPPALEAPAREGR